MEKNMAEEKKIKNLTAEKIVRVPDPVLEDPKKKKMPWRKKAGLIFFIGFLGGWLWMTWATLLNHQVGNDGLGFWRLLLPF